MNRREFLSSGASLVAGAALLGSAAFAQQTNIAIATGGTGGVYYPLGGGMANILTKHLRLRGDRARDRRLGRQPEARRLRAEPRWRSRMVDAALDALKGEDKFKGKPLADPPARWCSIRTACMSCRSRARASRRWPTSRASASRPARRAAPPRFWHFAVIEAAGLDKDKDMRRERLGVAESTNAIKDGKIDAYFWVGGLPTAAVTDLGATPGIKIKLIDHADLVDEDEREVRQPLHHRRDPGEDVSGTGQGQPGRRRAEHPGGARVKMSDKVAYDIVKTLHREARRTRRRARRGGKHHAREPEEELADPVASGRAEVFHREGRQGVILA